MVEKRHFYVAAALLCAVAFVWMPRTYSRSYPALFKLQNVSLPVDLELWRDVPYLQVNPCSWWTCPSEPTQLMGNTNGFIRVECSGGLNQMRRDLCRGVGITRLLNATLLLPRFEASTYWNDTSGFADIFDVDFFVKSMQGWVQIARELPVALASITPFQIICRKEKKFDYVDRLLPKLLQHRVIVFRPSAMQRSDHYPAAARSARCQACYRALRLKNQLQKLANNILHQLPRPFVALHLRFEPDMIEYSRCIYPNLTRSSLVALKESRGDRQPWRGSVEKAWRRRGKCPLTPQETVFLLLALRIPTTMPIYLAAGSGLLELETLTGTYSNTIKKSDVLNKDDLKTLGESSGAAIDWFVCLHSEAYIATFLGNMDQMVVADRVLAGMQQNLILNRRAFEEAKSEGYSEGEIIEHMWKIQKEGLISGHSLPLSGCFCRTEDLKP